jgi:hypothetical protein
MKIFSKKTEVKEYINKKTKGLGFLSYEIEDLTKKILKQKQNPSEFDILNSIIEFLSKKPFFIRNLMEIDSGKYMTMEGNADEMIVVGKLIKMGFNCSRVDVSNSKYDAVVDKEGKILRIQIKGTSTNNISLISNWRSGQQIIKGSSKAKKITEEDCDILIGVSKINARCFIIPATDLNKFGKSVSLSKVKEYEEKWDNIK